MSHLPRSVKVGAHRYHLHIAPQGAMSDMGSCDADRCVIALNPNQCDSAIRDSLIHEIIHACLRPADLDDGIEERVASPLGPALLAVLTENPRLIEWLTA